MSIKTLRDFQELIASDCKKNIILDTDAYNEVDDQFCIAYLMKRPDRINLLSINAAPFFNSNSTGPEDGMERSYQEILKLRGMIDPNSEIPVYRGSREFLKDRNTPVESDACENIINTVMSSEEKVIIVAIGAITNVASAILKCPEVAERAAVIWLGGHAIHLPFKDGRGVEFNMRGDIPAAQVVFDSGIDLLQIPCKGVCGAMTTTWHELDYYLRGKNAVSDYLIDIVKNVSSHKYAGSRVIWDVSAATVLLCPEAYEMDVCMCPRIEDNGKYTLSDGRHRYLYVNMLYRDRYFADLFRTLADEL